MDQSWETGNFSDIVELNYLELISSQLQSGNDYELNMVLSEL